MAKEHEEFEFPGDREAGMIGTAARTSAQWKAHGNLGTIAKALKRLYPPKVEVPRAGTKMNSKHRSTAIRASRAVLS